MNVVAIINPISGSGMDPSVADRRVATLRAELERRHTDALIQVTRGSGHAREIAAAAVRNRAALVIVWGGDGTVNEAASALVGSSTALGLVPAGSGNGLAAALGVPRRARDAVVLALTARARAIDVGTLAGRPFFNVAGVGFDAHIARLFNQRARGSRGRWPYVVLGVREGCRYRAQDYALQLDGTSTTVRALMITFANGIEFGMGAKIAPEARLDDGLLDMVLVEDRPIAARFWDARYLALGSVQRAPRVTCQRIRAATIEAEAPLEFHVDGECGVAEGRVEVGILPGALNVMA